MTKNYGWIIEKNYHRKGNRKIFSGWIATLVDDYDERIEIIKSFTKKDLFEQIFSCEEKNKYTIKGEQND